MSVGAATANSLMSLMKICSVPIFEEPSADRAFTYTVRASPPTSRLIGPATAIWPVAASILNSLAV